MNPSRIAAPLSLLFTLPGLAKTQTQAQLIADLNKAPNLSQGSIPSPRILTKIGKSFLISAWSQDAGVELFRSQGTPQTTRLVQDIYPGPSSSSPTTSVASESSSISSPTILFTAASSG